MHYLFSSHSINETKTKKVTAEERKEYEDRVHVITMLMESKLTQIIRFNCNELYDRLQEEYERATTDDAMIQEIKEAWPGCNFRKDGTIFAR